MKRALDYLREPLAPRTRLKSTDPITASELRELQALHALMPGLSNIRFEIVLATPHLIIPLRRTLEAKKSAAEGFELK